MFSDFTSDAIGFESGPETERLVSETACQTQDLKTYDQETQTTNTLSRGDQVATCHEGVGQPYDADKLLKFLNRVMPQLEEELKSFNIGEDLNFNPNENEIGSTFGEDQENVELSCRQMTLKPDFCKDKVVSCLSWNSSDVTLAVAYSEASHKGWCCHETSVGLYNTERSNFEKEPPKQVLKAFSCVKCIEFHSYIPSLLAGGLYNGEVVIWDLRLEEIITFNKKETGDEAAHVDVITFLTWREDESGSWLVTGGRDGRIIQWKVTVTNLAYEVYQRFLILKQHLITTAAPSEHLEVLHMDFQSSKGPYFVVASNGGTTFYCSLAIGRSLTSFPQYKDPVLHSYKPRRGIVTHVSCNSDLFASCGTDSEIHIFKYDQESPVLKIYTDYAFYGVKWNSPKELISWGDSRVECHKIKHSSTKSLICEVEGGISALAFKISSIRQIRKFSIGNRRGDIVILRDWMST